MLGSRGFIKEIKQQYPNINFSRKLYTEWPFEDTNFITEITKFGDEDEKVLAKYKLLDDIKNIIVNLPGNNSYTKEFLERGNNIITHILKNKKINPEYFEHLIENADTQTAINKITKELLAIDYIKTKHLGNDILTEYRKMLEKDLAKLKVKQLQEEQEEEERIREEERRREEQEETEIREKINKLKLFVSQTATKLETTYPKNEPSTAIRKRELIASPKREHQPILNPEILPFNIQQISVDKFVPPNLDIVTPEDVLQAINDPKKNLRLSAKV